MNLIFEIVDKMGKEIRLTKERWNHIMKKHPEVQHEELIKETLQKPDKITDIHDDETIKYYYKYYKHRTLDKYLLVLVKYLNGEGYVLSAYYEDKIK